VRHAVERGVNFFDTADSYAHGESERIVGEAIGRQRHRVVLATKVGYCLPQRRGLGGRLIPLLRPIVRRLGIRRSRLAATFAGSLAQDFSPSYIVTAAERSLRRLGTDYIDLYQLHSPPPAVLALDDWIEPLERLREEGKILAYGVACATVDDGLASLRHRNVAALQVGISLLEQRALDRLIPAAWDDSVGIVARQPFAAGFLTRSLDELDQLKVGDPSWPTDRKRITAFRALAERAGLRPATLALHFVRSLPGVSVTLMSVSSEVQLAENLGVFDEPSLPPDLLAEARSIMAG
jgi:aryl-alcohol dehydrogenase-like predicted oxidoreductase